MLLLVRDDPNTGILMEGIDPNAPIGQDDGNDQTPIIRPIVAPKEEEKKDDDRPPNIIGGTGGQIGNMTPPVDQTN